MHSQKILITELIHPLLTEGLTSLGFECDYQPGISQATVQDIIHLYTGLVVATRIKVDRDLISAATNLKFIARAGSGMENIDVEFAESKNIACINSPEGNANAVGEHALALLLAFYHNIVKSSLELLQDKWLVEENRVHELEGRTIGIIGYGNTGKSFAKKLFPFGMKVLTYDKYLQQYSDQFAKEARMEELFQECEIISLHVPLTEETRQLVNSDFLSRFSKRIFIINTSRGKVVNHADLLAHLHQNKLIGAGLDVYENEKFESHTSNDRQVFQELMKTGKVIFTPHVAGKSFESKKKIAEVLLQKIKLLL